MAPAKIPVIFFAISFLLLLSHGGSVPDNDIFPFSTAVSKQDPPENTDGTATVIPVEKSIDGSISAAVEPFHRVDLSLRRPIGHHIRRPINPHFPLRLRRGCHGHRHGNLGEREIPYGDDMIRFPRGPQMERRFPGEMRSIPRIPREFPGEMRSIPMRGPRIPREFPGESIPGEMRSIPMRGPQIPREFPGESIPGEMRSIPMRGPQIPRAFPGEMRSIPMRGPRIPREFPGEMLPISRRPEFQSGFWKERAAMVHGMREGEGRDVSMKEKVREKREEEREDGDFVKRFWAIVNRF